MHIGSDLCVLRRWGSVTVHRQWSDYHEGSAVRWAQRDRSGTKSAFGSQWWIGVWFVAGSAFGSWRNRRLDRRLVRRWSAFGLLADRHLVCSLIGIWIVLSLARSLFCSLSSFFLWLSLSLFCVCEEKGLKVK